MTPLGTRITSLIEAQGPITVADFMAQCLFDPEHGYYTTREPFGQSGDFTTAPEISQMFGELIGAWTLAVWRQMECPLPVTLAEIGPGRGTLMKDMLRTLRQLDPRFLDHATITLIETSPRLRAIQKANLAAQHGEITWLDDVSQLPPQPLILIGNELFDAVPIHQYVRAGNNWHERMVALDDKGQLHFVAGAASLDTALLPPDAHSADNGAIVELAPARSAIMEMVAHHLAEQSGAALFIDYGYLQPGVGDTLQALRQHAFDDVLAAPGEADVTSHVDFAALAAVGRMRDLHTHLTTQGEFLLQLGLLERAGQLGRARDEAGREEIQAAVERLAGSDAMGTLFKVLAVTSPTLAPPGFASPDQRVD